VFDELVILYATLDLQELERESTIMDVSGHYSRPGILRLQVTISDRGDAISRK
jgi:hypothetical protein